PFLVHIPCAAHTIQLCMQKIAQLNVITAVVNVTLDLISQFEKSKDNRLQLKNLQAANDSSRVYQLIKPCDTRWSSILTAIERILLLKHVIHFMKPQTDLWWNNLAALDQFLKPFRS